MIKQLNNITLAIGALVSLYFFIGQGSFDSWFIYVIALFLVGLLMLPFGLLATFNNRIFKSSAAAKAILPWALIITASTYIYFDAFSGQQDAQSALVFVVIPFYQLVACVPAILSGRYFDKPFQ
ncbi:MAG: hypothetical protein ACRBF0_16175 [Calditrichia bacterium]